MGYYDKFNTIFMDFCDKHLITNAYLLKDKTILSLDKDIMFFTDGTFCVFSSDWDDEMVTLLPTDYVKCKNHNFDYKYGSSPFWVPLRKFISKFYPDVIKLLDDAYEEGLQVQKEKNQELRLKTIAKTLRQYQDNYPELEIKFKNYDKHSENQRD